MLTSKELWDLHKQIRRLLNADETVTLGVAFRAGAKKGEHPLAADCDVLVIQREPDHAARRQLMDRINSRTGCDVNVVTVDDLRQYPYILTQAIAKGRVLKDISGQWDELQAERAAIVAAGEQQQCKVEDAGRELLIELGVLRAP